MSGRCVVKGGMVGFVGCGGGGGEVWREEHVDWNRVVVGSRASDGLRVGVTRRRMRKRRIGAMITVMSDHTTTANNNTGRNTDDHHEGSELNAGDDSRGGDGDDEESQEQEEHEESDLMSIRKFSRRGLMRSFAHGSLGVLGSGLALYSNPRAVEASLAQLSRGTLNSSIPPSSSTILSSTAGSTLFTQRIFDTRIGSFLPARTAPLRLASTIFSHSLNNSLTHAPPPVPSPPRVVVIGETHTHPLHHRIQLDIIRALHSRSSSSSLMIGMEQFYRQHQHHLDEFVNGRISLDRLSTLTKWENSFGYELALYTPLLSYARQHRIRIVGLNMPRQLASATAVYGLDELINTHGFRDVIPRDVDTANRNHYKRFASNIAALKHGGAGDAMMWKMYEAMCLWEEYMAESVAMVMVKNEQKVVEEDVMKTEGNVMVVLAGAGHVEGRDGLPERIVKRVRERAISMKSTEMTRRGDGDGNEVGVFTVLPESVRWTADGLPDIEKPKGRQAADWVWYTCRELDLV
mmetsp:Transcript_2142/g.4789  ORF Transcript_2142/g.4789 Transcript_2142/m.4789 type:complete len:519 (-) Transcript_2142:76-1632(-)